MRFITLSKRERTRNIVPIFLIVKRLFYNLGVLLTLWLLLFSSLEAQIPSFTENYSSSGNLDDNNNRVSGGYLRSGYAYAYYPNDYYYYDWGNIAYCSNSLYVVWADDRVDGTYNVYLAKINSANGSNEWSTNFKVNTLDGSMYRPSIFVKDKSHIYIAWGRSYGGLWYLYAQRFIDNGTSLVPQWNSGSDKEIDDGSPGPNDMHWWVGDTEIAAGDGSDNSAYITGTWWWTGSGDRTYLYSVSEDGSNINGDIQTPYRSDNGEYTFFYRGNSLLALNNYIYVFAYKWAWNSSTYKGDRGPIVAKNSNNSSLTRLNAGIYTTKRDPWNLSYAQGYVKYSLALSTNRQYLYFVWNDYRDGDFDVWIQRMSITNNSDLSNYRGNTGGGTWLNDLRVNNSVSGRQITPSVAVNPFNNKIYIVYRDIDENRLEYDIVSPDGNVETGSDIVLASYRNYHPKIVVDNTDSGNYFYVGWLKYNGGRRYIEVAKFDENGNQQWINSNVVAVTYKTKSHSISKQLSFTPPALSVKKATLTNLVAYSNGYNIKFYVSHNGGNNWIAITNNKSVVFDTPGWEFKYKIVMEGPGTSEAKIDKFTIKAVKYYTGDLLYSLSSNTGYAGEDVIEQLGTYQQTNLNIIANGTNKGVYFVRLKNSGNTNANFYIYGNEGNTYFDVQYYDGANNITSLVTSWTGFLVPNLAGKSNKTIRVEIRPTTNTFEGQEFYLYLYSYVDRGVGLHDSIRLKATAWKYRPDLAIKLNKNDAYLGTNIYEYPTPSVQQIATNANSLLLNYEEKHTNYVSIKNNGVWTDSIRLSITTNVTLCSKTNWSVYITNLSLNQKVTPPYTFSLPPGESNIFAFIIYPKISVVTNSVLTLDLLANSLNTTPSDDPLRMETGRITYQAFKKQPDLFIAPSKFFISRTGENLYSWTNTAATQYLLLKTVPDRDLSFFVRLRNNGESVDKINFHIGTPPNTNWHISYKLKIGASYNDKTSTLTNSKGTNFYMNPGDYYSFELVFTPNTNVPSGEWLNILVIAFSSNKSYVRDVVYVRPYNKKLRPDVLISDNTNFFIGDSVYETNGATQHLYNRLEIDNDKATNYIKVINKSPTEQDEIVLWGEGSTKFTNWIINYYNFTNSQDITADICSNGYSVTLQTNESFLVKLVVFPKATTSPDEKIDIHFKAYSKDVTSQQDVAIFSNIGVELKPDFKFYDNSGNNIYRTNDYTYQNKSTVVIAGVTNTNIRIKVENDGGSIESFRVISKISNFGGSITNWIINYYDVLNSQDITSLITNTGVVFTNMSPGTNRSIGLKIYAKWYGDSSTNSAVGNKINIKFDVQSVTKPSRKDVGSVDGTIKRGVPDIYFDTNSIGYDYYSTNFSITNRLYVPVIKYIPVKILMISKNRGVYKDDFKIKTVVSNGNNWEFSFTNAGNDITSTITGTGLNTNNLVPYGSLWIYSTFRATNGGIGDKVYFYNYFDTLSQRVRKDRIWMVGEITRGVPDIAGTNLVDNSSTGWGIYATEEQFSNNIMNGETNRYKLYLHNDITGGSNDNFILKQIFKGSGLTVKYYTNGTEISESDMTNGINLKINSDSYIPLEVLLNADSVSADSIKDIKWRMYLSEHPDFYDEFLIKTKKISVQPDLIVKDSTSQYGGDFYTNNYDAFQGNVDIIAGVTNNDITFRLENDGQSVENYRIESFWSNIGGNKTNWVVRYIDKNTLDDITSQITNNGYLYTLNAGEYREIGVKIYAKVYDISSTNSAVKNKIKIYCFARSETRTNIIDTASAVGEIKKGLPDIYCPDPLTAQNFITNSFIDTNKIVVGVVLGYPSRIEIRYGNVGINQDVFKYYAVIESNQNWNYSWTNIYSNNDLTSQVTNTNQGYISTNNSGGYDVERIRLTLTATNGNVGDSIYFYNYLDTVSKKLRRDVLWIVGKIVEGLPDIACSNYQNNTVYGWGKDATNESTFDLIEDNETNTYDLLLHNEAVGGSNALFVLKQVSKSSPVNLEYFTNGVAIPESDITNGLQIRINSDSVRKVQVRMSQNSATPDSKLKAEWKFYLKNYPKVYDTFTITNKKVEFKPDLWIKTSSWIGNNIYTNDYDVQQTTLDVISGVTNSSLKLRIENDGGSIESYRIKASWSNIGGAYSNWIVKFYYGSSNITAVITNQGYLYANLAQNQYRDIDVKIYPKFYGDATTNSAVGNKLKLFFEEYSETRNWHLDRASAVATIKRGIPDTYFVEGSKGQGIVTNQFINTNKLYIPAVIGYPSSEGFKFQNIGSYEDSFNLIMYVASNHGSWNISITNVDSGQNITGLVTNTNIGFSFTNNVGNTRSFMITLTPTNGSVGDKIYIYGKFRTKTLRLREDYFWIVGEIAEGIPDIAYSNIITSQVKGKGKSNPDETMFNLIEQNQTNFYDILLKNDVSGSNSSVFVLKEIYRSSPQAPFIEYSTNGTVIPPSVISNGLSFSLQPGEIKKVRLKVNLDNFDADNKLILKHKFYLQNSTNVYDTFTLTNKKVEINPDLVLTVTNTNIGYGIVTNIYNIQSATQIFFSGVENTNIQFNLINNGGSTEKYKFYSWWSNIGGEKSDWVVKYYKLPSLDDITYFVTNKNYGGNPTNFIGDDVFNMSGHSTNKIKLYIKPKWFGTGVTNSAVGNKICIYVKFYSTSLTDHYDTGKISGTIKRGLPDVYLTNQGWIKGKDLITNQYLSGNTTNIIIHPYEVKQMNLKLRNIGFYTDIFRFTINLVQSNQTPWQFSITNTVNSNEVTSLVTNTNIGIMITNLGDLGNYKITVTATNGRLNDELLFYARLYTLTEKKREDKALVSFSLKGGIPDIACSNNQTGSLIGWGRTSTNEFSFDRLEKNETNTYTLLLHNEMHGSGSSEFIFKETELNASTNISVRYFTNNTEISYTNVTNGVHIYLPANDYKKLIVKVNGANLNSGEELSLRYKLWYINNTNLIDTFVITNLRVNPGASIQFTTNSYTNKVYLLMGIDNYTNYFVKISNADIVPERFKLTAPPSDTYFNFKYYLCDAYSTNEITSSITSVSGYTTSYLSTNVVIIKTIIEATTNIYAGLTENSFIKAAPLKNLSLATQFNVSLTIVGGIPDIYAKNLEGNTIGSNVFATINSFTEKIEKGETNIFKIYLRNTGSTNADLTLKEDSFYSTGNFYRYYYDATTNIDIKSFVTNTGLNITLLSNSITNIILKVAPSNDTNTVSSNFCGIRLKLYLTHYTNRRDYFSLTNILVNPNVDLKITTKFESSWNLSNYDESSSVNPAVITTVANLGVTFYIAVVNKDKVTEDMIMQATGGNDLWEVKYYDENDKDITSKITNAGYTNRNVIGNTNFFSLIRCTVIPSSRVSLTDSFDFTVRAVTKKNSSRMDMVYGRVNINSFILKGKVINKKTKEPISGAKISSVDGLGRVVYTYSDANGEYELSIYPVYNLKNSLKAEASGYVSDEKTLYPSSVTNYMDFELVSLNMSSDKFDERIFPNPIKSGEGGTFIYAVAKDSHITIEMYDLYGRLIKVLVDEYKQKGVYYVKWHGKDDSGDIVPRGVYIFVMDTGNEVVRKIVFIK